MSAVIAFGATRIIATRLLSGGFVLGGRDDGAAGDLRLLLRWARRLGGVVRCLYYCRWYMHVR